MADLWDRLGQSAAAPKPKRRRVKVPSRPSTAPGSGAPPPRIKIQRPPKGAATRPPSFPKADRPLPARGSSPKPAARVDPEFAAFSARVEAGKAAMTRGRSPEGESPKVAGISPEAIAEFRRRGLGDGGGRSIGGFLQNLAGGGLDIVTSIPSQAQLLGEGALYPFAAGYDAIRGGGYNRGRSGLTRRLEEDLSAAGQGLKADYTHRWGPLFEGDFDTFAERFYDDPLPTILDVAGAKGAVGRTPNVARRVTRSVAPTSRAGMRADRALSTLSAEDRVQYAARQGKPIVEGPGGRYRPPRRVSSTVARDAEGGPVLGERTIEVPRGPYSGDAFARTRQRLLDRSSGGRLEQAANRREVAAQPTGTRKAPLRERAAAAVTRPFSSQSKFDRVQRAETRTLQDLKDAQAEVATARSRGRGSSAIGKLKGDKVGRRNLAGLSVEEAAFALHRMDMLGDVKNGVRQRGGLSAVALRDEYLRRIEGEQRAAKARGIRVENSAAQAQVIRAIPQELLDLTDMSNPAVKRVAAAVQEARRLNANAQLRSIEAGVVKPGTVAEVATRDSGIGVAGVRLGRDEIRKVKVAAARKSKGIKRALDAAQKRGDKAEVARLTKERQRHTAATKARIAAIRRDASKGTPELRRKREEFEAADKKLKEEQSKVATKKTLAKLYSGGRIAGRGERNLELAPKKRTGTRVPIGQPTRFRDTVTGGRGQMGVTQQGKRIKGKVTKGAAGGREPMTKRFSAKLAGGRRDPLVPHPPKAPGEARPRGINSPQGKAYGQILRGQGKKYQVRVQTQGASGKKITAATRARDVLARQIRKLEDEALGFTSPRRPELMGSRGVYVPDTPIDVRAGYTGPKKAGRMSGPDKARRSQGRLKARGNIDLNPAMVVHQHARAMQNYTGRISRQALDELLDTSAYRDPKTGKPLTGDRLRLLSASDSQRVQLVHVGNLRKALHDLDTLPEGKFLDDIATREVFIDQIPKGARTTDYVAISKAAADVWTEAMTSNTFLKGIDKGLNYWKGGLLALSPRWYVNNTFGLALQYGVMTGFDIGAIRRARKHDVRRSMESRSPNAVKDTMADDLNGGDIPSMVAFGFKTNAKLEEFWRRAAYMNRAKQALRQEGVRTRKLSSAEMARAIENMPEAMVREIVRDVDFFIGNYRKFSKVERDFIKRIIPFYSWLRVIARLTFGLPFRSPVRAAAMNTLSIAAEAGINPNDRALDYFERGALQIGGKAIPTWGLNPWQTLAPVLVAFGEQNPAGALAEEGVGWVHPGVQFMAALAFGTNNFGQGVVAPPGSAEYGQDPESFNPVTGRPSRQRQRMPLQEAFLQAALPGQISVIRRVAAGGRSPYDTVETADLILDYFNRQAGGERNERLYRPASKRRGRVADPNINPFSTIFGVPIYNQDDAALVKEAKKRLDDFYKSQRKLARQRKRAERG